MRLVLGILLLTNYVLSNPRVDPLVNIDQGLVRGRKVIDGSYSTFFGIPYAQVDLENPFGPAQPAAKFEGIFDAYEGKIACPQTFISPYDGFNMEMDMEDAIQTMDCLRLNIYVPYEASSQNPLPVLLWIHGGVFANGFAGEFNPHSLLKQGIIVVTINYRLGAYGFTCLDTPSVHGNQGLRDQYEALRWIRSNIGAFGGNPYNVTLAGQSAGAASALLHLYSPKEKLFSKVIAASGTPKNEGMFVERDVDVAKKIANYLGFGTTDTEKAIKFLSGISFDLVTGATKDLKLELRPCQELSFDGVESFISFDPYTIETKRKISNIPVMIGHTSREEDGIYDVLNPTYLEKVFYNKLKSNFDMEEDKLTKISDIVRHFYIGDKSISKDVEEEINEFHTDFIFNHPFERMVDKLLEDNVNVYEYMFSFVGDSGNKWAHHSADLEYLFDGHDGVVPSDECASIYSDRLRTLWGNFVKYGNPTPASTELLPVLWPATSQAARPYMVLDCELSVESRMYSDRMAFWDLFYENYSDKHISYA